MTRAQLLAPFKEQRSRAAAYVRDTDKPVKAHTSPKQILQLKASPGYPR